MRYGYLGCWVEEYVLFHELKEIEYQYQGLNVCEALISARPEEVLRLCKDVK